MSGLQAGALEFIEALATTLKDLDTRLETELQEECYLRQQLESSTKRTESMREALQSEAHDTAQLKLRLQAEQFESDLGAALTQQRQQVLVRVAGQPDIARSAASVYWHQYSSASLPTFALVGAGARERTSSALSRVCGKLCRRVRELPGSILPRSIGCRGCKNARVPNHKCSCTQPGKSRVTNSGL